MTIQELINYLEKEIKNFEPEQMTYKYLTFILKQVNQLEALSQEWIRANEEQVYFKEPNNAWWVEAKKLEGVLVPKQEVDQAYKDGYDQGKEHGYKNGYSVGYSDSTYESEITEEQAWYFIAKKYNREGSYWFDARNHYLKTIEKPVIPQFVAKDVIEIRKASGSNMNKITRELNTYFQDSILSRDSYRYFNDDCTFDEVLEILKGNYEIEEEPKYYVMNNKDELILARNNNSVVGIRIRHYDDLKSDLVNYYQLTEQEIKNYDPRYWAFAKQVKELEE